MARLRVLWDRDFSKVCSVRRGNLPTPSRFEDILPYVGQCCVKLNADKPVRIINGNNKDDSPNFEKTGVWAIMVGGTKLSRGYTVVGPVLACEENLAGRGRCTQICRR